MMNVPTIPSIDETIQLTEKFLQFYKIVQRLRKECPWDSTQTHESLSHLLIEEVYETVESISDGNLQELKKELGDLLLHVTLHAIIAEETESFNLSQVFDQISHKLVQRHPHIFSDTQVKDVKEVKSNWETLKLNEGRSSILEGVPTALPALLQAFRIQDKVAGVGFDWPDAETVWPKVEEELKEVREKVLTHAPDIDMEIGDLLFSITNYARHLGINSEEALQKANKKFKRRFQFVERRVKEENLQWKDTNLEQLDLFWDEAKKAEH